MQQLQTERLAKLEGIIEKGKRAFVEVGKALAEIKESKLYKAEYKSFDAYCKERWGFGRSYADRIVSAADVVSEIATNGGTFPASEGQARPLVTLDTPEKRKEAWQLANDYATDEGEQVSAEHVKHAVAVVKASAIAGDDPNAIIAIAKRIRTLRAAEKKARRDQRRAEALKSLKHRKDRLMADSPQFMQADEGQLASPVIETESYDSEREGTQAFVRELAHLYMDDADAVGIILLRVIFPVWTYDELALQMNTSKRSVIRRLDMMEDKHPILYEFARSKSKVGGPREV